MSNTHGAARLQRESPPPTARHADGAPILMPGMDTPEHRAAANAARVEHLISQLEERSLALVPYSHFANPQPPRQKFSPYLLTFLVVWVSSMAFGIFYLRYLRTAPQAVVAEQTAPPPASASDSQQQQQLTSSVNSIGLALASSSRRINQLEAEIARLKQQPKQPLLPQLAPQKPRIPSPPPIQPKHVVVQPPAPSPVQVAAPLVTPAPQPPVVAAAAPPKSAPTTNLLAKWGTVLDIQPTKSSVPHHNAMGAIDYWVVPRGDSAGLARVLPLGTNSQGVVIHNIDDGKEYTVTSLGDWKPLTSPDGNQ